MPKFVDVAKRQRQSPWQPAPDLDDSALVWQAVVRHGLTQSRSVLHPFGGGYGPIGLMGGMGAGTGGRLFTGPAAENLAHAQQAAIRGDSATGSRLAAWQFAALELAGRLNSSERETVRQTGDLPNWFPDEFKARAKQIRKNLRRSS